MGTGHLRRGRSGLTWHVHAPSRSRHGRTTLRLLDRGDLSVENERPVTGSCERCARGHDLHIPEPGSGDLKFQRIGALFSWCAGCGRVVGQVCCWEGSAGLCSDCAALRAAGLLTDASLARSALSGLSAATASMAAVDGRLRRMRVTGKNLLVNAWEDAWLDAGILNARVESADAAARRSAAATATPDDAHRLTLQLAALGATWDARNRAVADRLERVGLRIRGLGALTPPAAASGRVPPERELVPVRVGTTISPVTRLPVRQPASVGVRRPEPARPTAPARRTAPATLPAQPQEAPARQLGPARQPRPAQRVVPAQVVATERRTAPLQPVAPLQPAAPPQRAQPPPPVRPAPPGPVPPTRPVLAPDVAPQPGLQPWTARTSSRRAIMLMVALLGATVVVAAVADRLGGAGDSSPSPISGVPSPAESGSGARTGTFPSATATTASAVPSASSTPVTFDFERLGPLTAEAAGIARVLGAPEVAALPTPFDRSLLLGNAGSGACLDGVPGEPARSLAIDLRTGPQISGILLVTPTDQPGLGAALDLAQIPSLDPATWYRVELAWAGDGEINLEIRERDGGGAVHRTQLLAGPDGLDRSGLGSLCVEALRISGATAMYIDNARVGS